jgi:uncharacterized protein involved in cysteine biosynthesis
MEVLNAHDTSTYLAPFPVTALTVVLKALSNWMHGPQFVEYALAEEVIDFRRRKCFSLLWL